MDKLLTFSGYDQAGPHIFAIEPDREKSIGLIKMARPLPPKIEHYIRTAKPVPGKTQLLIDALGAGEYWGSNVNGDYFPEEALLHKGADYGAETFMHYAYPFKHHLNKDPKTGEHAPMHLRYGDRVTLAEYDPHMHRVVLIVHIDNAKCQDILNDLARGKYWDVSMGCGVPWDECSICRNRARSRAEYCNDLKYQMNRIMGDGRRVCAINRLPKFKDISFVIIGAEKASHVLKKVASSVGAMYEIRSSAEAGELFYGKLAQQAKAADIDKRVLSNIPAGPNKIQPVDQVEKKNLARFVDDAGAIKSHESSLPSAVLDRMAGFPLGEIGATLTALGIPLRPEEFQRIVLVKTGQRSIADKMDRKRVVFDEHKIASVTPSWARELVRFDDGLVNEKIGMLLRPYIGARSCYPEPLANRLEQMMGKQAADDSNTQMIYNRSGQWYPLSDEQKAQSSGMPGFVPAGLALAAGFMLLKKQFPQMAEKGPLRLIAKHPWLLPILIAGGVGASVGLNNLFANRPLNDSPMAGGLDAMGGGRYDVSKTASIKAPWMRLGLIPLAYIYAGIQQRRAERGEPLGSIDRFIATRPDLAAISSFVLAPHAERGIRQLLKTGSVASDVATYAIGAPSKFLPGVLAGALLDSAIFHGIARLARKKESLYADAQ